MPHVVEPNTLQASALRRLLPCVVDDLGDWAALVRENVAGVFPNFPRENAERDIVERHLNGIAGFRLIRVYPGDAVCHVNLRPFQKSHV
nr:hypothetical protein [Robbsia andropogonis]